MNLSPSSSFSSSVTAISSHDFTSKAPTPTVRCLVDILRRMLCSRSLPTHLSDQATDSNQRIMICKEDPDSTPGIVARLMGLDSLPENSVSKIGRSRSANYVENRGKEKMVKSSQSFREIPKYVELQDDEFFILSFERGSEIKELRSRKRKLKKRREKKAETEENRACEEENRADQRDSYRGADVEAEGDVQGTNRVGEDGEIDSQVKLERNSSLRIKQVEAECSSDDLSPVSVLDHGEFIRDPAATSSDGSKSRSSTNPRRKLSTELQTEDQSPPREGRNSIDDPQQKIIEGSMKELHSEEFSDIWSDIKKILGREMVESSNWAQKGLWRIEECEVIGLELEVEILDNLLDEVLDDQFS